MSKSKSAFTLIELLVVIAIIGLLVTLSVLALSNARVASRDAKRVSDVKQMQSALELFFDANNRYPTNAEFQTGSLKSFSSSTGTTTYMNIIPAAPTPNDGSCSTSDNAYAYNASTDGSSYTLNFCVAKKINDLPARNLVATPGGIIGRFNCGSSVSYAGESYPTVSIGTQCWMAKNLDVGTMVGSKLADNTTLQNQTNNGIIEKYCQVYVQQGNAAQITIGTTNCGTSGGLYQWGEAVQYLNGASNTADWSPAPTGNVQGICPTGWHLPTDAEYKTLEVGLGMCTGAGSGCVDIIGWRGTDQGTKLITGGSSGFTGLFAGDRETNGTFNNPVTHAYFWSSSVGSASAWARGLVSGTTLAWRFAYSRDYGFSVRCLKN